MKQLVGTYVLGFRNIRLFVDTETANGNVSLIPNDKGAANITIGIDCPFTEALGVLLHETYEAVLVDLNTRYSRAPKYSGESSDYTFIATHNELGEAHERVGIFLAEVYEDFSKIYEKLHRKMHK